MMTVKKVIKERRAYRAIKPFKVSEKLLSELATCASLAPSCYNKQPWRFVFVVNEDKLKEVFQALPRGNKWAEKSSLIVAVFTKKDLDCVLGNREYFLFDTGISTGFMILCATELGYVAHPIAGFDEEKVKSVLKIPQDMILIALIVIGALDEDSEEFKKELKRPERLSFSQFAWIDEVKT